MSGRGAKRSRLSVRYFDDRILLTETHAWAYFRVPTISYEFMTGQQREALATNLTVALAGIRMADAEVHLRLAHRSYPAAEWATGLHATSDGGPGWVPYLDEMYRQVWAKDFWTKEATARARGRRGPPGRDRQMDRARRQDRPSARGQLAGGKARHRRRGGMAVPARDHRLPQRPAAVRCAQAPVGYRRNRGAGGR